MGLSPQEMNDAIVRNLKDKTGKSLGEWIEALRASTSAEKKEIIKFLKEENGLGHFQAQTIYKHYKTELNG